MQTTKFIPFAKDRARLGRWTSALVASLSVTLCATSPSFATTPAWVAQYDVGNNIDVPVAIRTDNFGNTYVAGYTSTQPAPYSYTSTRLAKYNSAGVLLWEQSYQSGNTDVAAALAVDSGGNAILVIQSMAFSTPTIVTIKYTPLGSTAWVTSHPGQITSLYKESTGKRVAIDGADNVYITGLNPSGNIMVKKYAAANGSELWGATYDSGGTDIGLEIMVKNIYVYVAGVSEMDNGNRNLVVLQLQKGTGIRNWASVYNKAFGESYHYNFPNSICSDDSDRLYVTGVANSHLITLRYNTAGTLTWEYRDPFVNTVGVDIASTSTGIYVAGDLTSYWYQQVFHTPVTIRHQFDGTVSWRNGYASPAPSIQSFDLEVDTAGNAYLAAGRFDSTSDESASELNILKYDPSGALLWTESYPSPGSALSPFRLTLDPSNNIYATRSFYTISDPADTHWLTLRYNAH
jgi:hypothetical protein